MNKAITKLCSIDYIKTVWGITRLEMESLYKSSFLGFLWAVIAPFIHVLIYTVIIGRVFDHRQENYTAFLVASILPWVFISQTIQNSTVSLVKNRDHILRSTLPKVTFPLSQTFLELHNFIISFILLYILLLFFGQQPHMVHLFLPLMLVPIFIVALMGAIFMAYVTPLARDMVQIIDIFIRAAFWFSAIIYPIDMVHEKFYVFIEYNPFYILIEPFRALYYANQIPDAFDLYKIAGLIILTSALTMATYLRVRRKVIWYL